MLLSWTNFFILSIASLMFVSCGGVSPNDYKEEIDDAVKFYIALANTHADIVNNHSDSEEYLDELDQMHDEIIESYILEVENSNAYEIVLKKLRTNTNNPNYKIYASSILEYYSKVNTSLTNYKEIRSSKHNKIWNFTELNTGLEFIFDNNIDDNTYEVSPLEKSYDNYISKLVD